MYGGEEAERGGMDGEEGERVRGAKRSDGAIPLKGRRESGRLRLKWVKRRKSRQCWP